MNAISVRDWWTDRALEEYREAVLSKLYGQHLFPEIEDDDTYHFQPQENGSAVWLRPGGRRPETFEPFLVEADMKFPYQRVYPQLCLFYSRAEFPFEWFAGRPVAYMQRHLQASAKELAKEVNQAFVDVLATSAADGVRVEVGARRMDECLAQACEAVARSGFRPDRFLFHSRHQYRLAGRKCIIPDEEVQSTHYVGRTSSGLYAFCGNEVPEDTAFVFASDVGRRLVLDPEFGQGDMTRGHALPLWARIRLNSVVTDTRGVVALGSIEEHLPSDATARVDNVQRYVDSSRIRQLRAIAPPDFDLARLVKYCEELNSCYANSCYLATAMLVRAILDHVPPVLNCAGFSEVANNYAGSKSFKQSMEHLENSCRKIADSYLHVQIRSKEELPNKTQVNFVNDLDVLLAEIVRVLK